MLEALQVMWLFPVVFMLHDFEEIVMFKAWFARNGARLEARFPSVARWLLPHMASISTPGFALAVAEELLIFSLVTLIAIQVGLYAMWAGMVVAFLLHLVMHFGQFVAWRGYVPVIATSGPAALYCLWALWTLDGTVGLDWGVVALWSVG